MKYVSVSWRSYAFAAVATPDTPPMTNRMINPAANSIGVLNTGRPCHMVAIHEKTAMALGIVITMLAALKNELAVAGRPVANIWWTQTPKPSIPVLTVASATNAYPTSGRRQNVGIRSETMPIAGRTTMYTHGCPKLQNR